MEYSEALITGKGVTLGEAFAAGGQTTVVGMGIVFGVLVILMIVLVLFRVIFYREPKKTAAPVVESVPVKEVKPVVVEEEDEEELIAVLTAAVAASLNTSTYNLKIKSYRRIENNRPAWNRAGLSETIGNRF